MGHTIDTLGIFDTSFGMQVCACFNMEWVNVEPFVIRIKLALVKEAGDLQNIIYPPGLNPNDNFHQTIGGRLCHHKL